MLVSFQINKKVYDYECNENLNVIKVLEQVVRFEQIDYEVNQDLVAFLAIEKKTVSLNNSFKQLNIKHQELIIL